MVWPAVILLADLATRQVLVADVSHRLPHWRFTLLGCLVLAGLRVEVPADAGERLLLAVRLPVLLLLLVLLGLLCSNPPLTLPIGPHMGPFSQLRAFLLKA